MIARTRQSVLDKQTFAEHVLAETDDNVCSSCTPNKQLDVDTCFPMVGWSRDHTPCLSILWPSFIKASCLMSRLQD
eukprot:scaffold197108_cov19-Tisochrysis_lutea.AAC.1